MLVAVDIGNTNIVLGFLDGDTIAGVCPLWGRRRVSGCFT